MIQKVPVEYPESDGKPMADNTKQAYWIVVMYGNIAALFAERTDVFVALNLMWYPVEGETETCNAPDVLVIFDRPKGHRGSYKQWEEGEVPVTVAIEILSPRNTVKEMTDKLSFNDDYGVEEYYVYDPETNDLSAWVRRGAVLRRVWKVDQFVSPRLGIRFDLSGPEMVVYYPDGKPFLTFEQLQALRREAEERAEREARRAEQEAQRAEREAQRARAAEQRAGRLAELGRKARRGQATPEELAELERLETESPSKP